MIYSISLLNGMALTLIFFGIYIVINRTVKKRQYSEWRFSTTLTVFLWAGLALSTDFLLQMTIQDRLYFHLASIPILLIAWLVVRFYYRVKVY
ncbi:MAG: hypothetical protein AB8F95_01350 [Bacteroidia bacterium]